MRRWPFGQEAAFQSTRPVKGATLSENGMPLFGPVSIHAPREGRDSAPGRPCACSPAFQSTRPVKGATRTRTGTPCWAGSGFNPRAP